MPAFLATGRCNGLQNCCVHSYVNLTLCMKWFMETEPPLEVCSTTLQGFYTVYSGVFQKLAEEERQAASLQGDAPPAAFPPFGQCYFACCLYNFRLCFGVSHIGSAVCQAMPVTLCFVLHWHALHSWPSAKCPAPITFWCWQDTYCWRHDSVHLHSL